MEVRCYGVAVRYFVHTISIGYVAHKNNGVSLCTVINILKYVIRNRTIVCNSCIKMRRSINFFHFWMKFHLLIEISLTQVDQILRLVLSCLYSSNKTIMCNKSNLEDRTSQNIKSIDNNSNTNSTSFTWNSNKCLSTKTVRFRTMNSYRF